MDKISALDVAEAQPLLSQPATGIPAATKFMAASPKVAPRQWRGHWYQLFGDCSAPDVVSGVLALKMPLLAWSWNQSRSLQLSFFRELLRFAALTIGLAAGIQVACCVVMMSLCPEAMSAPDGPRHTQVHGRHHHERGMDERGMDNDMNNDMDGPQIPQECLHRIVPAYVVLAAVVLAAITCLALFLARRRTALRERFGIDGSAKQDVLLYLCCAPCAIAQETRTLIHEQVHEGVWYGSLPGVQAPNTFAVPVDQKMSA